MTRATAEQMAALTVPATLPGVVRDCTPVVSHTGRQKGIVTYYSVDGWVVVLRHRPPSFNYEWPDDGIDHAAGSDSEGPGAAGWRVDLTDATGRAHVAAAICAQHGGPPHIMPSFWLNDDLGERCWRVSYPCGRSGDTGRGMLVAWSGRGPRPFKPSHAAIAVVPDLAPFDPYDNTRLPDGSRLVDALALRAVAMHVLGGGR